MPRRTLEKLNLPPESDGWAHRFGPGPNRHRMHRHDELELNLVTRGTASYLVEDRRYDLARGTLIWLFPGQDHVLINDVPDFAMWIVVFRPSMIQRVCTEAATRVLAQNNPPGLFCKPIPQMHLDRLGALCRDIDAGPSQALQNAGLAYLLLQAWEVHRAADQAAVPRDIRGGRGVHPAVERAAYLIRDRDDSMKLDELARKCGLSPSRLSRLFRREMGTSLVNYRQRQRFNRFLEIYGEGGRWTMLEASARAGFGSYPQFHRVFKQVIGYNPAEYRRRLAGEGAGA